jgi:DNA-binding MarR family transcriptional regulator
MAGGALTTSSTLQAASGASIAEITFGSSGLTLPSVLTSINFTPGPTIGCGQPSERTVSTLTASIVSFLTMGKPDLSPHAALTHGDLQYDASGYLHDAAMRRAVIDMGGKDSVEVLEALAALRLAAKQIHDHMERFAESHGLSDSRLRVLTRLYHSPSRQLPLGVLAEGLNVTPRTMTDIIDVLERDGLVRRVPDPADRRSVLALITETGLERINAMRTDATAKQAAIAKGFTGDQLVQLRHLSLLLVRNLSVDAEGS